MSKPLYGLVLAGGKSRRMGQDKALLLRAGQSQLSYVAALLEGATERVFVSARHDQQDDPERSRFATIVDRYENIGPIAGILSAMDEYPDADCPISTPRPSTTWPGIAARSRLRPIAAVTMACPNRCARSTPRAATRSCAVLSTTASTARARC